MMPAVTVAEIMDNSSLVLEFSLPQDLLEMVSSNLTKVRLEIPGYSKIVDGVVSIVSPTNGGRPVIRQ